MPSGNERDRGAGGPAGELPEDLEAAAGMSDDAVSSATGRGWAAWVEALDALGAAELPHPAIARHLEGEHGLDAWWAQMVTVGYERLRGLRQVGQGRDGGYEVSRSRTYPVPLAALWEAFADEERRSRWLPDAFDVTTLNEAKNVRTAWPDGGRVEFRFSAKGEDRSTLTVQHRRLPDAEAREARRAWWGERLDALGTVLSGGAG